MDSNQEKEATNTGSWANRKEIKRQSRRLEREIKGIEEKIAQIEERLEEITEEMNELSRISAENPETFDTGTAERLTSLSVEFDNQNEELDDIFMKWEELQLALGEIEDEESAE